ncbi:hypothetical protein ACFY94_07480 [Streptomyces griseorubiginosus]|uniref:hypothetical protein n=1 Tax=Streptomyces griseorubiginosus TaxID=67304 RepID=UPI0036E1ECA8
MTSSPNFPSHGWVLKVTISAAPAAAPQWKAQLNRLRPIAWFDDTRRRGKPALAPSMWKA